MNIVFFGTSEFAMPALERLIDSKHEMLAVVTQPDRKKGRSLKLSPPPVKVLAMTKGIPVYQPLDASSAESAGYLSGLRADLFVVISFGQILKDKILSIPKLYPINLHGSCLPKYRGAAPTNWAIINDEKSSGVTVIKMNERMDEGDIILKREINIDDEDTNITLTEKLSELGAKALLEAIDSIEKDKNLTFTKQDAGEATYAPKLKKEDGLINWRDKAVVIHNKVRGLIPWPGAYTHYEGKVIKVLKTEICGAQAFREAAPGEVIDILKDKGIIVCTGSEPIAITHLQLEGKIAMDADSFVRGHKIAKGCPLG
ncbi:MAG: methionyl-tRNA formyltransferase [Candidatus Omnitrophica bacterium]|nr:methionyl-tRNA formyltransferase [Candidatus Omnitrophota bacterium]